MQHTHYRIAADQRTRDCGLGAVATQSDYHIKTVLRGPLCSTGNVTAVADRKGRKFLDLGGKPFPDAPLTRACVLLSADPFRISAKLQADRSRTQC